MPPLMPCDHAETLRPSEQQLSGIGFIVLAHWYTPDSQVLTCRSLQESASAATRQLTASLPSAAHAAPDVDMSEPPQSAASAPHTAAKSRSPKNRGVLIHIHVFANS